MKDTLNSRNVGLLGYALSVGVILALWQYGSSQAVISMLFPSPASTILVAANLWNEGRLLGDIVASLREWFLHWKCAGDRAWPTYGFISNNATFAGTLSPVPSSVTCTRLDSGSNAVARHRRAI